MNTFGICSILQQHDLHVNSLFSVKNETWMLHYSIHWFCHPNNIQSIVFNAGGAPAIAFWYGQI